jgi:hypothetical protein
MVVFSLLVGIATHILWDAFTHPRYWLYNHWHFLHVKVLLPLFGFRPWYAILQYLSSVLGIVVILLWCIYWYRNTAPVHSKPNPHFLTGDRIALGCAFLVAVVSGLAHAVASGTPHGVGGSQRFMSRVAITGITILWIEIVIYGVFRDLRRNTVKPA